MKRSLALALCLVAAFALTAQAKDWFVNPVTGVDAWPGFGDSPASPFASISFCFGGTCLTPGPYPPVAPGDRIICAPGPYDDFGVGGFECITAGFPTAGVNWIIPDVEILGVPDNPLARGLIGPPGFTSSILVNNIAAHTPAARFDGFTVAGDAFNGMWITGPGPGVPTSPTISNNVIVPNAFNCLLSLSSYYGPHYVNVIGNYVSSFYAGIGSCVFGTTAPAGDLFDHNMFTANYIGNLTFGGGFYPGIAAPLQRSNCTNFNSFAGQYSLYGAAQMINETVTVGTYGMITFAPAPIFYLQPHVLNTMFQYNGAYDLFDVLGTYSTYYMGGSTWYSFGGLFPYYISFLGNPFGFFPGPIFLAGDACHLTPASPMIDAGLDLLITGGAHPWFYPANEFWILPATPPRPIWGSGDIDGDARFQAGFPGNLPFVDVGADELDGTATCRIGNVNDLGGPVTDVVFVNGTTGGVLRETTQDSASWLNIFMLPAPVGAFNNKYYCAVFPGEPTAITLSPLPKQLGIACFTVVNTAGNYVLPFEVANTIAPSKPIVEPPTGGATGDTVPGNVLEIPPFMFFPGQVLTVQGLIGDGNSTANVTASITNAVVVTMN